MPRLLVIAAFALSLPACKTSDAAPAPPSAAPLSPSPAAAPSGVRPRAPVASAAPPQAAKATEAPVRYPFDRTHSPITPDLAARLRGIAAKNPKAQRDVFAKIGDSVTFSDDNLRCFAHKELELGSYAGLLPTIERFRKGNAAGTDPYRRESEAAKIGWSAWQALSGSPSPVDRELSALSPSIALVQYGTNDIEIGALHHFADHYWNIVDHLIDRGVVPVLFTIMPRTDRVKAAEQVPLYNAVIRGVAQARQVPLVDYFREIEKLPGKGLGKDGIHPTTFHGHRGRDACALTPDGLRHGYNLRNRLAIEALSRVSAVLSGAPAPDPVAPPLSGTGAPGDPFVIPGSPFIDSRILRGAGTLDGYGCSTARPAPGPEIAYRLELPRRTALRIFGFDRGGGEVDIHLLRDEPRPNTCVASAQRVLATTVSAGRYYVVLDRAKGGVTETLLVVFTDP